MDSEKLPLKITIDVMIYDKRQFINLNNVLKSFGIPIVKITHMVEDKCNKPFEYTNVEYEEMKLEDVIRFLDSVKNDT